jgi:hypothetical protein
MIQGFKHGLEKELQEYYRILAIIQAQVGLTFDYVIMSYI